MNAINLSKLTVGALVFVIGCSDGSAKVQPEVPKANLALSYQPGATPTGKLIGEAQAKLRKDESAESAVNLAILLMRRRRETSKPIVMLYAKDAIKLALKLEPKNVQALVLRGMAHQYDHEFEKARDLAQRALKIDGETLLAHLLLGDALLELGDYDKAIAAYQAAVDLRPNLQSYNRAAHIAWLQGDMETAVEWLDMAIDAGSMRDPESTAWCFVDLGDIFRHRGQSDSALAAADRALKMLPEYVPALVLKARTLAAEGELEAAIASYDAALSHLPTVDSLVEQAELLRKLGRSKEASVRMTDAIALSKDDPRPLAHYYARMNVKPKDALRLAQQELKARQNIAAWDTLALAQIRNGQLEDAEASLLKATQLGRPLADLHLHEALLHQALGRAEQAKKSLTEALALNPQVDPLLVAEIHGDRTKETL